MLFWVVTGYLRSPAETDGNVRAEEEGVVAIDQADRGGQLRLRSNLVEISTSGWGGGQALGRSVASRLLARADEIIE
jgi:hypothetical protein